MTSPELDIMPREGRQSVPRTGPARADRTRSGDVPRADAAGASGSDAAGVDRSKSAGVQGADAGDVPKANPADPAGSGERDAKGARRTSARRSPSWIRPSALNAKMIYASYLASLAIPPAAIVGVYFAHQARGVRPEAWLVSHYTYQIRTFWIGLVANLVAYLTAFVGIGLLLFPLIAVWVVARSVHGLTRAARHEAISDPQTLFV